jgi:methylmalonyl-CoA mutase
MKHPPLLAEFPTPTAAQWRAEVEAQLKGAPFDKKMRTPLLEGFTTEPLYTAADTRDIPHLGSFPGFAPFVRGRDAAGWLNQSWDISQEISLSDPLAFNLAARHDLARGLTSLNVVLDRATRNGHDPDWAEPGEVGVGGLSIATLDDLRKAFQAIDLEKTALFIRSGSSALPFAALFAAYCQKTGLATSRLHGCIEMDPLGVLAHEGRLPHSLDGAYREMAELMRWACVHAPRLQTVCVHTRSWHEGGGHAVQELAFALATAADYLRALAARGLPVHQSAPRFRFAITVGADFFKEIAKLRAARLLWAQLTEALGGPGQAQPLTIHVRCSTYNKTAYDAHTNLLRATVEAFAGVLGGANSLQVAPFDETFRTPDEFSRRIARNTQLILQKECQLDRLIDPVGGSWYVESLTDSLARAAWDLFRQVEKRGGMAAALQDGFPQQAVADTAARRLNAVAHRRTSIIGTNQYANPRESYPAPAASEDLAAFQQRRASLVRAARTSPLNAQNAEVLDKLGAIVDSGDAGFFDACVQAILAGATLGEITRAVRIHDKPSPPITPVCLHRAAFQFENLRRTLERSGIRPKVLLLTVGPLKQHKARADYAASFFEIVGAEILLSGPLDGPAAFAPALAAHPAPIAVLCSTDETYPDLVPAFLEAAAAAPCRPVTVLAGYPADHVQAFQQAGLQAFIHLRCNALETLTTIFRLANLLPAPTADPHKS